MICFCDSCTSLRGIGAPFLYLWCMAGVTNFQMMEKFDEVNKRMDGQDETLKSIQSSLVELTYAVKALEITHDKKLHDSCEEGESSSAIKGENGCIRQVSTKECKENRKNNECIYCREKYTQEHKCPDAKDGQIDDGDYIRATVIEESDDGKMSMFSSKPDLEINLGEESSLPLVNNAASGIEKLQDSCEKMPRSNRFAAGKSNYWRKQTNPDWKLKTKDESFGSHQNDDSSFGGACTSVKMLSLPPKPDLNPRFPPPHVKNASSLRGNFKPIPDSSQKADNVSKVRPKFVYTFAEKGKQIGDNGGKPEDSDSSSMTRYDICPKKVNTAVKLKAPIHLKNKERRNQFKLSAEGPNIKILRHGMVLMKGYISFDDQVKIVKTCRELGIRDGGFYQPGYNNGTKLHLRRMCLGRNWDPQSRQYVDKRPIDNSKPPKIPDYFHDMVKKAIQDSNLHIKKNKGKNIPSMLPDICIVNFYTKGGKLGLHQDKDESRESLDRGLPVVSFSIGDKAEFLYGDERDVEKAEKVELESGDVLIFGGESRHVFHGVPCIVPDSASKLLLEATDMCPGRLNLTFKQY